MLTKYLISATCVSLGFAASLSAAEVNIYSARHYDSDEALYAAFTKATGIEVNRIEGQADELIARMKAEGDNSPVDVFFTTDVGRIWRADKEGLLQAVDSDILNSQIPESKRHPDGHWFGVSERARLIFYSKERVDTPPTSYADLADPANKGKICIRTSSNIYNLSLMGSIIANQGEEAATQWAAGLLDNLARNPEGGDTDQLRGIVSGACDLAVANSYYFARALTQNVENLTGSTDQIGVVFPNQDTTGTHVNIAAAGVAVHAPHRDNAIALIEFMVSPEAQTFLANMNSEYPIVEGAPIADAVKSLGEFKRDNINLSVIGENQPKAQEIFNSVGFP